MLKLGQGIHWLSCPLYPASLHPIQLLLLPDDIIQYVLGHVNR